MSRRPLPFSEQMPLYVYSSRLQNLRAFIKRKKIDAFLVTNIGNVGYLTGFTGSSGFLLIAGEETFFITDFRYGMQAEKEVKEMDIVIVRKDIINTIKDLLKKASIKTIGLESSLPYILFQKLSKVGLHLRPYEGVIERLREIKDDFEVEKIKEAVRRAEISFLQIKPYIKKGVREKAIALRLEDRLKRNGCSHIPFDIIVASGPHSAMPHAKPTDRKIDNGDLIIIDWGGEADGYFSDMTRTLIAKGGILYQKRKIHQLVFRANREAIANVLPGRGSKEIDSAAREVIKKAGYSQYFGHATGHGVGLHIHESPRITWNKNRIVRENMIFTIEPGIYVPDIGGVRIEDMVFVRPSKAVVLTTLPRRLGIVA